MPMQRDRYPENWEEISRSIRERAGNKCEWCGLENGALGYRDERGKFWTDEMIAIELDGGEPGGKPLRRIKIILTVAHLGTAHADGTPGNKHDKMDCRDDNLAALCQRCHLNYDRDEHMANAAATRLRKKQALYVPMFED